MSVYNIDVRNLINRRLGGQTQIINRAAANTFELYGIKYNLITICTNYVNLYTKLWLRSFGMWNRAVW
jgi:hypothetical protein